MLGGESQLVNWVRVAGVDITHWIAEAMAILKINKENWFQADIVERRVNEPRTPLARPGQGAAGARTACSSFWVVYGGLRDARSEGGEGVAGGVGSVRQLGRLKLRAPVLCPCMPIPQAPNH
jgi:hypothetical protein